MAAKWIELVTGSLEQKKQYRQIRARIKDLPEPYGPVATAFQRYFMYYGGIVDGEILLRMMGDFAETFAQAYTGKRWIDKERARLTKAIEDSERGEQK